MFAIPLVREIVGVLGVKLMSITGIRSAFFRSPAQQPPGTPDRERLLLYRAPAVYDHRGAVE